MRVLGYVRVSTEEQAREGVSLQAQEARLRAYCDLQGLDLVEVLADRGVSASRPLATRPAGKILLERLERREAEGLVAVKLDRLWRNTEDGLACTRRWARRGVGVHILDLGGGQGLNTSSAMGRFLLTQLLAVGQLERDMGAERTSAALQHLRATGKVLGKPPFGWRRGPEGLEEVPEEQAVIARVRELVAAGLSQRAVAARMAEETGRPWRLSQVQRILSR